MGDAQPSDLDIFVGKDFGLFAAVKLFVVPTSLWLLLDILARKRGELP